MAAEGTEVELPEIDKKKDTKSALPSSEGNGITTKLPVEEIAEGDENSDDSGSGSDDGDMALAKFLHSKRPTAVQGEPSHNVQKKVDLYYCSVPMTMNPWCISFSIMVPIFIVMILMTIFAPSIFEYLSQNLLHFMIDDNIYNDGKGSYDILNMFMLFFVIFNVPVFCICGNIDYLLMVFCGYLYSNDDHHWLYGSIAYLIPNYVGCFVAFAIGRTLFRDKLYEAFSKHERYRFAQKTFTDHALLLSIAFNLCPFIPSGLIVYGLSISHMSWIVFFIGQAARIPIAAIMSYAGYTIRRYSENDSFENSNIDLIDLDTAYKSNSFTYHFTVGFSILFAILFLFISCAMYLQYQRLILGDALKKSEEEFSEIHYSDKSVTDSNEDMDDESESDEDDEDESDNTFDEYLLKNNKRTINDEFDHFHITLNKTKSKDQLNDNSESDMDPEINEDLDPFHKVENDKKHKNKKNKSKHLLDKNKQKKKKKKKKKYKINNAVWQTIKLANSPRNRPDDDNTMLFQEKERKRGPQSRGGSIAIQMTDHLRPNAGSVSLRGSGGSMSNNNSNNDNNNNKKGKKKKKQSIDAKSPSSPKSKFKFSFGSKSKKNDENKSPKSQESKQESP